MLNQRVLSRVLFVAMVVSACKAPPPPDDETRIVATLTAGEPDPVLVSAQLRAQHQRLFEAIRTGDADELAKQLSSGFTWSCSYIPNDSAATSADPCRTTVQVPRAGMTSVAEQSRQAHVNYVGMVGGYRPAGIDLPIDPARIGVRLTSGFGAQVTSMNEQFEYWTFYTQVDGVWQATSASQMPRTSLDIARAQHEERRR